MWRAFPLLQAILIFPAFLAVLLALVSPSPAEAHHYHHGHSGYLFPDAATKEMNGQTATALPIRIWPNGAAPVWETILPYAAALWSDALDSTTGFDVYDHAPYTTVHVDSGTNLNECSTPADHGCVEDWIPSGPTARIYMVDTYFSDDTHRLADLMHEMGHVLYHANDHYPAYNCTSIMGHCPTDYTVSGHDVQDYKDAFGVKDAPNATYGHIVTGTQIRHHWEGGYDGGDGLTIHQETKYWIDRAIGTVSGPYDTYKSVDRIASNSDDGSPNSITYAEIPGQGGEWCFKIRGQAGGLASGQANYWGPLSKAYCAARSNDNVFTTSDRNGNVFFRVWNHSGATITSAKIWLYDNTELCFLGSITNGSYKACSASVSGPAYANVYYNSSFWPKDTVGFDG